MITKSYDHIAGVWFVNHVSLQTEFDNRNFCHQLIVVITISKAKKKYIYMYFFAYFHFFTY